MRTLLGFLAALMAINGWGYTYILQNSNNPASLPVKWPPGMVPLVIMLGTDKTLSDGSTYSSTGQAAANAWNAVLGDLQFQTQVVAAGTATNGNGVNELAFGSDIFGKAFGTGVLAVTTTRIDTKTNDRIEGDTIFDNKDWTWDSYRGPLRSSKVEDLQRVAIHELGHTLGLDHPDEAGQTVTAIMNSHVSSVDALVDDDITGVQNLYGPPPLNVPPVNDNFAQATVITLANNAATLKGYNTNATKENGEPNHAANAGGHSVWWKWTASGAGAITIDTKGSYCDTTLAVYTGASLNGLTAIASNDDLQNDQIAHVQASLVTFNATGGTTYMVAVDGFDGDSSGLTLNLAFTPAAGAPAITTQPVSQTVDAGANVSFSVTVTDPGTLTYQWLFNGTAINAATGATLNLTNVQPSNAGSYIVTVTNSSGSVNSSAATLTVNALPVITTQPINRSETAGNNTLFSVTATGAAPLSYQWFFGGTAVSGATSATLNLSSVQTANAGSYFVTVSNAFGSVNSNTVTLTVTPPVIPSASSSGGGGGGAPSLWFITALSLLGLGRFLRPRN